MRIVFLVLFAAVIASMAQVDGRKTPEQEYAEKRILQLLSEQISLAKKEDELFLKRQDIESLQRAKDTMKRGGDYEKGQIRDLTKQLDDVGKKKTIVGAQIAEQLLKLPREQREKFIKDAKAQIESGAKKINTTAVIKTPEQIEAEKRAAEAAKEARQKKTAESTQKAIAFQLKRAEEGSAQAQYDLGMRYLKGDGVEANKDTAKKWLEKAAEQDHTMAKKKLEEVAAE